MDQESKKLGKFCSVAKEKTIIYPKHIPGYITPEGQVLEYDGQKFTFKYIPIEYDIKYNLNGGEFNNEDNPKKNYTIKDSYTPPIPHKTNCTFLEWIPKEIIPGTIEDITFVAKWKRHAILLPGKDINNILKESFGLNNIISIQIIDHKLDSPSINLSETDTHINAYFQEGIIYLYSDFGSIYCNINMENAFIGCTLLKDISALAEFKLCNHMNINNMFKDCRFLADVSPVTEWGSYIDTFIGAFDNTSALETGRVPLWYKWNITIEYKSISGKILNVNSDIYIPGQEIFPININGYRPITKSLIIDSSDKHYEFIYEPIEYQITYELSGGKIVNPKETYTTEDETYYPPKLIHTEYKFKEWDPECINSGSTGNIVFTAKFYKKEN